MYRRDFIKWMSYGAGAAFATQVPGLLSSRFSVLPRKVKSVIFITASGGPSAYETFVHKPDLVKYAGRTFTGYTLEQGQQGGTLMAPEFPMQQYGDTGRWVADPFSNIAKHIDELCFIESMSCSSNNHGLGLMEMNTGDVIAGYPSIGSWVAYAANWVPADLPRFVAILSDKGAPRNSFQNWDSGILPKIFSGYEVFDVNNPIQFMQKSEFNRDAYKLIEKINENSKLSKHQELVGRNQTISLARDIEEKNYKLFYTDDESEATLKNYGYYQRESSYFAKQLIIARRLAEKEVPFIQVYHGGGSNDDTWDHHDNASLHKERMLESDIPISALLSDLKDRGLWDETLVVWGGEFGRTPFIHEDPEMKSTGRGHNNKNFFVWMAGGAVKPGFTYGESDELGMFTVKNQVTWMDVHSTILHLLGIDPFELKYKSLSFIRNKHRVIDQIIS